MQAAGSRRTDLYASITNQIIAALENGAGEWRAPWHGSSILPANALSQKAYRGINTLILWLIGAERGYDTAEWATFRQWKELGCSVRGGEKAATIVFWKSLRGDPDRQAELDDEDHLRVVARAYSVFNAAQVEGYSPPATPRLSQDERIARAERFFAATGIPIRAYSTKAYYQPSTDEVYIPRFERFRDAASYYAVLAHECVHATSAPHRLSRDLSDRFGSERYAMEELVAELGAAFVCGALEISAAPREDHAAYIGSWLRVLQNDRRAIFTAAGHAQKAADWLCSRRGEAAKPGQVRTTGHQGATC